MQRRWLAQKIKCQRGMYQFRWEAWHEILYGVLRALILLVCSSMDVKTVEQLFWPCVGMVSRGLSGIQYISRLGRSRLIESVKLR
jgi:hypothetical protein